MKLRRIYRQQNCNKKRKNVESISERIKIIQASFYSSTKKSSTHFFNVSVEKTKKKKFLLVGKKT